MIQPNWALALHLTKKYMILPTPISTVEKKRDTVVCTAHGMCGEIREEKKGCCLIWQDLWLRKERALLSEQETVTEFPH